MTDTSREAYAAIKPKARRMRDMIYDLIEATMATCEQVEEWTGWPHQTVSARLRELSLEGRVVDTGFRRKTRSGRNAIVYAAV
jgi:hypothetical protein